VLIHCAGGVGRTAMLAISVLLALGEPLDEAESVVSRAGSTVETAPQIEMLSWCASKQAGLRSFKVQSSRVQGVGEKRVRDRFKKDKG
jgi:protein-tyrosine phosphatase